MNPSKGYYRDPTVYKDMIVFVSEDDLWSVSINGGLAIRLTANLGQVRSPAISGDGRYIAFVGSEEGVPEVYVMPAKGGSAQRLTHLGEQCHVLGWRNGEILFSSNHAQAFRQNTFLYTISPQGGEPQRLPYGLATCAGFGKKGVVIGRKAKDLARWKRYRGGTAGEIWIDRNGNGKFSRLLDMPGNFSDPMWLDDRIYFVSDYEGIANIYSVLPDGKDIRKHTKHKDYYVRNAATDGQHIVYHCGGEIYLFNIKKGSYKAVEIDYNSPFIERQRKFVTGGQYLEQFDLHPQGSKLALECRGKLFNMGNWEGGVVQCGKGDGVRYRLSRWLNDGQRIVTVSDEGGEEHLEVYDAQTNILQKKIKLSGKGRLMYIAVSPDKKQDILMFCNHRNELYWLDIKSGKDSFIDRNKYSIMSDVDWSPDGKWIAYANNINSTVSVIKLYSLDKNESYQITKPVLMDGDPAFSRDGKYLYFISYRIFNPVYDVLHFDLGFPKGSLPYVVTLNKDIPDPFQDKPKGFIDKENDKSIDSKKETDKKELKVKVDLKGIEERVVPLPVNEGNYYNLWCTGSRVFYMSQPISGVLDETDMMNPGPKASLKYYDLQKKKEQTLFGKISGYSVSADGSALAVLIGKKLKVIAATTEPDSISKKSAFTRETGWIDLNRIKISVNPPAEWKQMYDEAWRLQRDFFWVEDMSGIDWKKVYKRYYPLLERISTRVEFADLVWEMQGELGTSHAYELGGDYRKKPVYQIGRLGADFQYDAQADNYIIKHIVNGDVWDKKNSPPLKRPGLNIKTGMRLKAINGRKLSEKMTPGRALVNFAGDEVELLVSDKEGKKDRIITVKTLRQDKMLRYREWVEQNKEYVHAKSKGTVGYIHIPDMMGKGYAEFHRHFLKEFDYDGLIVDVRYNGGGHVSQLLLEKLARKRIGYDLSRWFGVEPFPQYSLKGPIVALTNEFAGSDGDIFSHSFKLMKLGKLIGKRTWGGVIGISPRNRLVDGGITTQPEFSFWFKDVGWKVENYGTDPDIDVDITPQDYAADKDPQLDKALEVVKKEMKGFQYLVPDVKNKPKLNLP